MTQAQISRIKEIKEQIEKGKFGNSKGLKDLFEELVQLKIPQNIMEILCIGM